MRRAASLLAALTLAVACGSGKKKSDRDAAPPPADEPPPADGAPTIFEEGAATPSRAGAFQVELEWLSPLKAEEYLSARLTFATGARALPKTVEGVAFEPWMPSMGHGTAMDDQKIAKTAAGLNVFQVDDAYFIMGGEWEIRITATVDGVKDTAVAHVRVP